VHHRASLAPGTRIAGPAIVEEPDGTTLVAPGDALTVRTDGSLLVDVAAPDG
jgi:N-methylhydantoinase A/oxoprolinase/acetone carboxylase beta subunit